LNYTVRNDNPGATVTVTERRAGDGVLIAAVGIRFDSPSEPRRVVVQWEIPCTDVWSVFSSAHKYERNIAPSWKKRVTPSRLASGSPVQQLISSDGRNRLTIALSDASTPTEIATGVVEKTAMVTCEARFFTERCDPVLDYAAEIRLDFTDRRYDAALKDVERWWAEDCGYPSAYVPDGARRSVYSTWYSFHQSVNAEAVLRQCELAKPLGMDVVIVDDGWQTSPEHGVYSACGDWVPYAPKFPDMKAFVGRVHGLGMKAVLWCHLPAMGVAARHYAEFLDMALNPSASGNCCLDPRFPKVRRYLCDTLTGNAVAWGLDGYKLDFIDSFKYYSDTPAEDPRRDTLSIDEGVDKLLTELTAALRGHDPDFLIEFRQSYTGPVIRKFGNMIRVGDCPADSIRNHTAGTDLRLLLGRTPVHSDMLMWNEGDTLEAAANQVISTLFLVPQISVLLDRIPDDHLRMLRFYLSFRNAHVATLMDGELTAENPEGCYSLIRSELGCETVAVSTSLPVLKLSRPGRVWHINSTAGTRLYIERDLGLGTWTYTVYSPTGDAVSSGRADFDAPGITPFDVPRGGMLELASD
jgi:alpha-galactosidase